MLFILQQLSGQKENNTFDDLIFIFSCNFLKTNQLID